MSDRWKIHPELVNRILAENRDLRARLAEQQEHAGNVYTEWVRIEAELTARAEAAEARLAALEEAALAACFALTQGNKDLSKSPVFSQVAAAFRAAARGEEPR